MSKVSKKILILFSHLPPATEEDGVESNNISRAVKALEWIGRKCERESEIEDISQIDREMVMDNEDSTHTGPVLLFLLSDENLRLYSHSISDTDSHTKNYVPHPSLNISCSFHYACITYIVFCMKNYSTVLGRTS